MLVRSLIAAALMASAAPALAQTAEISQALKSICAPFTGPGASGNLETYAAPMKAAGWQVSSPPGVSTFNKEGSWGRVRATINLDARSGPPQKATCHITVFPADGAKSYDSAPLARAVSDWVASAHAKARKTRDNANVDKGPAGAKETAWLDGKLLINARTMPLNAGAPVAQIDVKVP